METLKRVVIKEELVAITGDYLKAIILQQFLYWTDRMKDIDRYLEQENKRLSEHGFKEVDIFTNGWIYKTAEELSNETMLNLSIPTMRKHIKALICKGYLSERKNPKYRWDNTTQYRVDLNKVSRDLQDNGYHLEGYRHFGVKREKSPANAENQPLKNFNFEEKINRISNLKNLNAEKENLSVSAENFSAIPEITTETTTQREKKESELSLALWMNKLIFGLNYNLNCLSTKVANLTVEKSPSAVNKQAVKELPNHDLASQIIEYLNKKIGTNYSLNHNTHKLINARLEENYTLENFKTVIDKKCKCWKNTPFAPNLKPRVLFSEKNFDDYLNEPDAVHQEQKPVSSFQNFERRQWDFELIERMAQED